MSASEHPGALTAIPSTRAQRRPMPARLRFYFGPMDCGKSTLALQIHHNHARQGRAGLLLTRYDRSQRPMITTRVGLSQEAVEVGDDTDLRALVRAHLVDGRELDYLIVDEAGFLDEEHVDQLAELVDEWRLDVYCFGLSTDFRSRLLPGAKRLFELADELLKVQVEVLCWCGQPGLLNARVVDDVMVREGATVVVADTDAQAVVRYQVLCRQHYVAGRLNADDAGAGQLLLEV